MGRKKIKVRWTSIENESGSLKGGEEETQTQIEPTHTVQYKPRRPLAPRFERKAAAGFSLVEYYDTVIEDLPIGFTKIRSKNLDVLFKRDYDSHKAPPGQGEGEDSPRDSGGEEDPPSTPEEGTTDSGKSGEIPSCSSSTTSSESERILRNSKLNSLSSPFVPSYMNHHPQPLPPMAVPFVPSGRPNLFLYSPSSNTMIPCEEVVIPMAPEGHFAPQSMYLAAMPPAPPPMSYYHPGHTHPCVYSETEPSSESITPQSSPDISSFSPAHWADATQEEPCPDKATQEVGCPKEQPIKIPGLNPQPAKKSSKRKRKKKSKVFDEENILSDSAWEAKTLSNDQEDQSQISTGPSYSSIVTSSIKESISTLVDEEAPEVIPNDQLPDELSTSSAQPKESEWYERSSRKKHRRSRKILADISSQEENVQEYRLLKKETTELESNQTSNQTCNEIAVRAQSEEKNSNEVRCNQPEELCQPKLQKEPSPELLKEPSFEEVKSLATKVTDEPSKSPSPDPILKESTPEVLEANSNSSLKLVPVDATKLSKTVQKEVKNISEKSDEASSKKSSLKRKKKRNSEGEKPVVHQVLIRDWDHLSFSGVKRAVDITEAKKGCLDNTFVIKDIGTGLNQGPISSGRLRVGKYTPPDRSAEIMSMKLSLEGKEHAK